MLFEGPYLLNVPGFSKSNGAEGAEAYGILEAWDNKAYALYALHGIELTVYPGALPRLFSDHKPFYWAGIPVVLLTGLYRHIGQEFEFWVRTPYYIFHTTRDCLHYINETWPGKADDAMSGFSLFLEKLLLHQYG